jgi:hypothetical protein
MFIKTLLGSLRGVVRDWLKVPDVPKPRRGLDDKLAAIDRMWELPPSISLMYDGMEEGHPPVT